MIAITSEAALAGGFLPVLCCCDPENLAGFAPSGLDLPTRVYDETDAETGALVRSGAAYVAHGVDLADVPEFVPVAAGAAKGSGSRKGGTRKGATRKGAGTKKGTKRTWRG